MAIIKNIGSICPTDGTGTILNDSSLSKVPHCFMQAIEQLKAAYLEHMAETIHSIYIRGSIPRGFGIEGVSDLDSICVINKPYTEVNTAWRQETEEKLVHNNPCITGIEIQFVQVDLLKKQSHFHILPFMIKTHSICVYGDNLIPELPQYECDSPVANFHLMSIGTNIQQAKDDVQGNNDDDDKKECCQWIAKQLVRAGMALTIPIEHAYTRDLFPAYTLFCKLYPDKSEEMMAVLKLAIDPVSDERQLIDLLNSIGNWLIEEAEHWIQLYNPEKMPALPISYP
ncbi:nucleotidyltransferase [Bacillus sp. 1P06AnD]|uniref:nucleotidyltransferase n=1 Tax=Bacillus sp. 1P06AnD TaxID=3132208 RepID=UPI00399F9590